MTFLGTSAAAKRHAHLGLSALYDAMPARWRSALDVAILLVNAGFFGLTAWYGIRVTILQMENRMMASLGYPSWIELRVSPPRKRRACCPGCRCSQAASRTADA